MCLILVALHTYLIEQYMKEAKSSMSNYNDTHHVWAFPCTTNVER